MTNVHWLGRPRSKKGECPVALLSMTGECLLILLQAGQATIPHKMRVTTKEIIRQ